MKLLFIFSIFLFSFGEGAVQYKKLQGPPSEFDSFRTPSGLGSAEISRGGFLPISVTKSEWIGDFIVDSETDFSFCGLFKNAEDISISLQLPGQPLKTLQQIINDADVKVSNTEFGFNAGNLIPAACYEFINPAVGRWGVQVSAKDTSEGPIGYFALYNESPFQFKYYNSENLLKGQTVQLKAQMLDAETGLALKKGQLSFGVSSCKALIQQPGGSQATVSLHDDGLLGDELANDGLFTGHFLLSEAGGYSIEAEVFGTTPNGIEFFRSVQNYIQIVDSNVELGGAAKALFDGFSSVDILVPFTGQEQGAARYLVFAEVWGTSILGADVPIAWTSAISDARKSHVELQLNTKWVAKALALPPYSLRNVRIQDTNIQTVLATAPNVPLRFLGGVPKGLFSQKVDDEITFEMRNGRIPANFSQPLQAGADSAKLLLIHGYCSDAHAWPISDFENALVFSDPNANRNLDEFANLIIKFAEDNGVQAYSVVAHSQGGLASLHLASYYWSGLDLISGGRIIQSVGSPYKGTSLAGSWAGIGSFFGVGCGNNDGMTKSGAAEWLSGIPPEKQQLVYYYTTQGSSACSSGANFLGLDKPNDGVTSKDFSQLPHGNYVNHKEGWCHTADMTSPAQCTDKTRNQEMNSLAARKVVSSL